MPCVPRKNDARYVRYLVCFDRAGYLPHDVRSSPNADANQIRMKEITQRTADHDEIEDVVERGQSLISFLSRHGCLCQSCGARRYALVINRYPKQDRLRAIVGNLFRKRPCFLSASLPIFRVIQADRHFPLPPLICWARRLPRPTHVLPLQE